jgi:hypothetical protein
MMVIVGYTWRGDEGDVGLTWGGDEDNVGHTWGGDEDDVGQERNTWHSPSSPDLLGHDEIFPVAT